MSTATALQTIGSSLTVDPARWSDVLVNRGYYGEAHGYSIAEREVVATASAIIKDGRPVHSYHNSEGRWAVRIDPTTGKYVSLVWSAYTPDEISGSLRHITRGEAVMVLCHEMFHVLFTTEIKRPSWCKPEHWRDFFTCVNFAEDVRIEDLGESVVPVFSMLRRIENDRSMAPNSLHYDQFDFVRKVMIVLYAEACCTNADVFDGLPDAAVQSVIDGSRAAFTAATNAPDTPTLVENLRPLYDLLVPYLDAAAGGGGDQQGGDESGEGEDAGGEGGTTQQQTAAGEDDSGEGGSTPDKQDATNEGGGGGGAGHRDEDADEDEDDGATDGGEDEDDATDTSEDTTPSPDGNADDPVRPDRERNRWDTDRDTSPVSTSDEDATINGDEVMVRFRTRHWTHDDNASRRMAPVTRRVVRNLRRTLQDNANGGWISRRKRGAFDASSAKRLGIGDLRAFRARSGPKGSLDFSLVLCLDSSGSVCGSVGECIADSGVALYEAARQIDGLDVALCVYGSGVQVGIPFSTDPDTRRAKNMYTRALRCIRGGSGGGTMEADALVWARAVSRKRAAQAQMIVVITDGQPYAEDDVRYQIAAASREGVVTGGIGVGYVEPEYHTYHQQVTDAQQVPHALGNLIRTMMRAM